MRAPGASPARARSTMKARHARIAALVGTVLGAAVAGDVRAQGTADEYFLLDFVAGDYVVVGREPDGGAGYAGAARIERRGDAVVLVRRVAGAEFVADGRIEVPSPPDEGEVLRFRTRGEPHRTTTCLAAADLDNYARLTCTWTVDGRTHRSPGVEALFPTAAWAADAPGRW